MRLRYAGWIALVACGAGTERRQAEPRIHEESECVLAVDAAEAEVRAIRRKTCRPTNGRGQPVGPAQPCGEPEGIADERVTLEIGAPCELELEATTDADGRARFEITLGMVWLAPETLRASTIRACGREVAVDLTGSRRLAELRAAEEERVRAEREAERQRVLEEDALEKQRAAERAEAEERARREEEELAARAKQEGAKAVKAWHGVILHDTDIYPSPRAKDPLDMLGEGTEVVVIAKGGKRLGLMWFGDPVEGKPGLIHVDGWVAASDVVTRAVADRPNLGTSLEANLRDAEDLPGVYAVAILELDVLAAYDLADQYATPDAQKQFKQSAEYKRLLKELKKRRAELRRHDLVVPLAGVEFPYDLDRRRFSLGMGQNFGVVEDVAAAKGCVDRFCFPTLPIAEEPVADEGADPGWRVRWLYLDVGLEESYEIDGWGKVDAFFVFRVDRVETRSFEHWDQEAGRWVTLQERVVVAKKVRVLVTSPGSDDLLIRREF